MNRKKVLAVVALLAAKDQKSTDESESEKDENQKGNHKVEHGI